MSNGSIILAVGAEGFLPAFVAALWFSYYSLRNQPKTESDLKKWSLRPETRWAYSSIPLLFGLTMGAVWIEPNGLLGPRLPPDRFYPETALTRIKISWMIAGFFVALCPVFWALAGSRARWILNRLAELAAASLITWAGVRFQFLGAAQGHVIELGNWAVPLTIAWLLVATWAVRLLDGLDGAAPILLLTSAVAVFVGTWGTTEFFLAGFSATVIGAVLGCIRFHFYPARLPLRGSATAAFGFVFAVLTVMARQKTVAALLLIFPLAVVVLLLGGAMLGLLERTLSLTPAAGDAGDEAVEGRDAPTGSD